MTVSIALPFPQFLSTDGEPIDAGFVYVGAANLDPVTNPTSAFWDAALSVPATQPIRTINGFMSRSGSAANVYVDGDFSIAIKDQNGILQFTAPSNPFRVGTIGGIVLGSGDVIEGEAGSAISMQDDTFIRIGSDVGGPAAKLIMATSARVEGNLVPDTHEAQTLGSETRRWLVRANVIGGSTVATTGPVLSYSSAQPTTTTNQISLNQLNHCLLCGYFDGTGSGAGTFRNSYNVTTKTRTGLGTYTITVPGATALPQDACIIATPSQSAAGGAMVIASVNAAGTTITVTTVNGVAAVADLSFSLAAFGQPRTLVVAP